MCTFKYVAQKECAMRLTNSLWKFRKKKYCQSLQNHGSLTWLGLFPPIFPRCHTNLDPAANGGRRGVRLNRSKTGLKAAIQTNRRLRFLNTMTVLADASKTAIISIFYPLSDLPGLYQKSWMKVHKKVLPCWFLCETSPQNQPSSGRCWRKTQHDWGGQRRQTESSGSITGSA